MSVDGVYTGNLDSIQSYTPAYSPSQQPDPAAEAERILDVGVQGGRDDYQARLDAFAESMQNGDAAYREALMTEILNKDPDAINSWLNPAEINSAVDSNRISYVERATIAENYAAAYNNDHPAFATVEVPADAGPYGSYGETRQQSPLDEPVLRHHVANYSSDPIADARAAREFVDFINSSHGPEAAEFRENYSRHLIDQYVLNDGVDELRQHAAAGIAANLMGGDYTRPDIAVDVLSGYDAGQRQDILDHARLSQHLYSDTILQGHAQNQGINVNDVTLPDGLSRIYYAVGRSDGAQADQLGVEFARLAADNPGWFEDGHENYAYQDRTNALTSLVHNKSEPILDELTEYDRTGARTTSEVGLQQYQDNARDLGTLFRLTLFNPDAAARSLLRSDVLDYAEGLTADINAAGGPAADGFDEAAGRLAMLSAATGDAVTQGYAALRDERAAQQEMIGFAIDLALAAFPLGDKLGDGAKNILAEVLPEGAVRDAVQGVTTQLIDESTGRLTGEAKEQIAGLVGADEAELIEQQAAQDLFEAALVAGVTNERDRYVVVERADRIADDLANMR